MEKCVKKVKIQHNDKVWLGEVWWSGWPLVSIIEACFTLISPTTHILMSTSFYLGMLSCLSGYMNIVLEQTEEHLGGKVINYYRDAFTQWNSSTPAVPWPIFILMSFLSSLLYLRRRNLIGDVFNAAIALLRCRHRRVRRCCSLRNAVRWIQENKLEACELGQTSRKAGVRFPDVAAEIGRASCRERV